MQNIAVVSPHLYRSAKREALMFDKIGVLDFEARLPHLSARVAAEIEWLATQNIVVDPLSISRQSAAHLPEVASVVATAITDSLVAFAIDIVVADALDSRQAILKDTLAKLATGLGISENDVLNHVDSAEVVLQHIFASTPDVKTLKRVRHDLWVSNNVDLARAAAAKVTAFGLAEAVALVPADFRPVELPNARQDVVLDVVIAALPQIDDSTPWEKVLEFRADEDAQRALRRLRRWIASVPERTSASDLADELQSLVDDYVEYVGLHKLKTEQAPLQTFITVTADVIENILGLKFGAAARALFQLRARRIALLEAELNAPSREIAYIVKAHSAFPAA